MCKQVRFQAWIRPCSLPSCSQETCLLQAKVFDILLMVAWLLITQNGKKLLARSQVFQLKLHVDLDFKVCACSNLQCHFLAGGDPWHTSFDHLARKRFIWIMWTTPACLQGNVGMELLCPSQHAQVAVKFPGQAEY